MKKFLSALLAIILLFSFTACFPEETSEPQKLATPTSVACNDDGLITWGSVENATEYEVTVNTEKYTVTATQYQVSSVVNDFTYSVVAKADGYVDSDPTQTFTFVGKGVTPPKPNENVKVSISGATQIKSGKTVTLKATVSGAESNTAVEWEIVDGAEFATIDENGSITAIDVEKDEKITVRATSIENGAKYAERTITIIPKPVLTQAMLDEIAVERISFEGYITISLYTMGLFSKLEQTYDTTVMTAMDGTNWTSTYTNGSTGVPASMYYKKHDGYACQIGVSFLNEEEYYPMTENGEKVNWEDSGLYNSLVGLSVDDFRLNDDTWRFDYVGSDFALKDRVVSSANPYDFVPKGLSLMIEDDAVAGIYSMSEDDYDIVEGYKAVQELFTFISLGDDVEIPEIVKYGYDENHAPLKEAIENMQALENYTLNFWQASNIYGSGYVEEGFVETITADNCYFRQYEVKSYDVNGDPIPSFIEGYDYGYKKISSDLYNSYFADETGGYYAARAFEGDIDNAKPSFAFAAEIFTKYSVNDDGSYTYYVDSPMAPVASTFYYGVGNDINLYGIFASDYIYGEDYLPSVTVKDGYIVSAMFAFYLGSIYGVAVIEYSDFNTATLPQGVDVQFETRYAPNSWSQLEIVISDGTGSTADDVYVNALDYLKTYFEDENIAERMPFFGNAIGDTFGFCMETVKLTSVGARECLQFYYDVPLDVDYTINESLAKMEKYLLDCGFTINSSGEFVKGNIGILPADKDLDFMIYVWRI